jgi:CBS domain containing-hemolysin-like protein
MTLLIFYLLLALGVSFICSFVEAAILSIPQSRIELLKSRGKKVGRLLDRQKQNIDRSLAAILTLNTISHTIGAAGVGAQALVLWGSEVVAIVSAILTILILVLSEIIPKNMGVIMASSSAPFVAYSVQGMIYLTYPFVVVLEKLAKLITGGKKGTGITREELTLLADLAMHQRVIKGDERKIIHNLIHLAKIPVEKIMTPRTVTFMLAEETTVKEVLARKDELKYSRIPLMKDGPDQVSGMVLKQRIFEAGLDGKMDTKLKDLVQEIHRVPQTATVTDVFEDFLRKKAHLFLVEGDYGGTAGVVSLEDAVETLIGREIVDETDQVADMRELATKLARLRRGE